MKLKKNKRRRGKHYRDEETGKRKILRIGLRENVVNKLCELAREEFPHRICNAKLRNENYRCWNEVENEDTRISRVVKISLISRYEGASSECQLSATCDQRS